MPVDDSDYEPYVCRHGVEGDGCEECDAILEANGGVDKCLNCGRYKAGNQLNRDQVCRIGCVNPNEY